MVILKSIDFKKRLNLTQFSLFLLFFVPHKVISFNIKKLLLVDNLKINNLTINILFVLLLSHLDSNDLLFQKASNLLFQLKKINLSYKFPFYRLNYRYFLFDLLRKTIKHQKISNGKIQILLSKTSVTKNDVFFFEKNY